jgi:hypothetical protein
MRVRFLERFSYVTHRSVNGTPRASVAYPASREPVTVPRDHGEAAVKAGAAVEVKEPAKRPESPAE